MGLRELRLKRGWTQRELAVKADVPQSRIASTETGARPIERMSLGMAVKLADALRVRDLRELLLPDDASDSDEA
ncbi:helix-turn-helix domain-containing protein [Bifidobacterium moraviense]|uniref:helix-turn-helix domain-containing protein n=1 Tax=Bifidobacterium moraviense TaxID=2675323 RepID=UPI00145E4575|nr:helix-turn-helix transcriptional regulator [Bifidobacterium sp. DSM 109958]